MVLKVWVVVAGGSVLATVEVEEVEELADEVVTVGFDLRLSRRMFI